ncbi:MAG: hypothetical protein ACRD08_07630 [Acidimicrobiales bacterium]
MTTDDAVMRVDVAQRGCDAVGWVELDNAWDRLRPRDVLAMPDLVKSYRAARSWRGRAAAVSRATRFARDSELAFQLGLEALTDQAGPVRHRACGLLAYSVRRDSVTKLRSLLGHSDPDTRDDARAAIAAILSQNHHLFKDREFSGQIFWIVCEADLRGL